jgi:hypothetical protein
MILHFVDEKKETLSFHFPSVLPSFRIAEAGSASREALPGKEKGEERSTYSAILN